ncbi:reverse transcriptase domain-containing protein [Tanacetum coccineum]
MADNRTMAQLLQAPTEGYEDAIVIPEINANFELKHGLISLVQNKQFFGHDKEDPHAHIRYFNKITSTMRFPDVPSTSIKLMLFPFSLEGSARIWLEKEPPRSILTWDDLVSKFINQFFPPSKTTNLRNEITRFQQRFDELFYEARDRFNDLLRACPHHGFSELHQLDTFYNTLNANDQDSLNSTAGGNLLDKMPCECLRIIESKSKTMLIDKQKAQAPAPVKMVEQSCVTCGGAHSYRNCPATDSNVNRDNIQEYVSQAAAANFNQGNTNPRPPNRVSNQMAPPGFAPVQNNGQNRFNQDQNQGNNFNRGNNFHQNQVNPVPNFQNQGFQNQPFQAYNNQFQQGIPSEITSYMKANESIMRNMQGQINEIRSTLNKQEENLRKNLNDDMRSILRSFFQNQASTSGTLSSNTIPNPKGEMKAITTRSGAAYEGLSIPTNPSPKKLADRLITRPKGLAEDIFVKVGNFHFPTDFVVVDFEADPRVLLILGKSFLRTSRALIDVYEGELVLRDGNEQITFHVNDTQKHKNESIKMVNDACKDSFKRFTDEPTQVSPLPSEDVNNEKEKQEVKNLAEPTAKRQTRITPCLKNFKVICKESIFHSNKPPQVSSVFAITSTLPKDSLIMGDDHLSTFSTEENIPILRESEETSRSDSKNDLPSCEDFSSIKVLCDISVIFSNPLFEFDVNFNNPLFDEELEDIECKDSYDSNLDKSTFLVTPLSDSNKDESVIPRDDIEFLLHDNPSTPLKSVASILEGFINDPPFEENDDLFDLECKTNDKSECFNPEGDNDEIDVFLAIEVPTYIEGYYDSEGDVTYLESLPSDDTTHNRSPKVFFDHEPQQLWNEPENEPLSLENSHTIIEFLPTSTTLIKESDPNREEIDIFSRPDNSIPPGTDKAKTTRKTVKTGQTRTQERKSAQKAGRKLSKSNYGQAYKLYIIKRTFIGQSHVKNDMLDDEKAQERWDFTLLTLSKEAQAVSITD